jgi:aspartate/methionine/tyrosine aminotransferase
MRDHENSGAGNERLELLTGDRLLHALRGLSDPEERTRRYSRSDPELINLSVAENVLIYDYLSTRVFEKIHIGREDIKYQPSPGSDHLRKLLAEFLDGQFAPGVTYENLFAVAGVSGALECLAFVLFDGETERQVLTPAPCWQGFRWCFEQRPRGQLVTFKTNGQLTLDEVKAAFQDNPNPRALVLTNPHNPLGINYKKDNLEAIYRYVLDEHPSTHIVSDEMYAFSQTGAQGQPAFVGAMQLDAYRNASPEQKQRVHVVWGFAKDFGLSGFRSGLLISTWRKVLDAFSGGGSIKEMSWFSPTDSLKQVVLNLLLEGSGQSIAHGAITLYQSRLKEAYAETQQALDGTAGRIPYAPGNTAAQFFWLDLRRYLNSKDLDEWEAVPLHRESDPREQKLDTWIRTKARVALLPGGTLSAPQPGFFRLCYTAAKTSDVVKAVQRIAETLPSPSSD